MDLFRGKNAYTALVDQATDESLLAEDLSLNLAVVEAVQIDHNGPKDVLRAVRKRLFKSTEPKVQLLSLSLLDMLVKNCGSQLYNLVADKDFLGDLVKLIRDRKTNGTVRDKALDLLQCWRAGLLHEPAGKQIEEVNVKLKREGIDFPARDLSTVPPIKRDSPRQPPPPPRGFFAEVTDVLFGEDGSPGAVLGPAPPGAAYNPYMQQAYVQPSAGTVYSGAPIYIAPNGVPTTILPAQAVPAVSPAQRDAQIRHEFVSMKETLELFAEALVYADPASENVKENPLITEFYERCQAMQPRLVEFISEATDEQLVADMIALNEQVVSRFEMYHSYAAQYARAHAGSQPEAAPPTAAAPAAVSFDPLAADVAAQSAGAPAPAAPQSDLAQLESIFGAGAPMSQADLEADMRAMGIVPDAGHSVPVSAPAAPANAPVDDFDAFFEQRLQSASSPGAASPMSQSSPLPTTASSNGQPDQAPSQGPNATDFSFF